MIYWSLPYWELMLVNLPPNLLHVQVLVHCAASSDGAVFLFATSQKWKDGFNNWIFRLCLDNWIPFPSIMVAAVLCFVYQVDLLSSATAINTDSWFTFRWPWFTTASTLRRFPHWTHCQTLIFPIWFQRKSRSIYLIFCLWTVQGKNNCACPPEFSAEQWPVCCLYAHGQHLFQLIAPLPTCISSEWAETISLHATLPRTDLRIGVWCHTDSFDLPQTGRWILNLHAGQPSSSRGLLLLLPRHLAGTAPRGGNMHMYLLIISSLIFCVIKLFYFFLRSGHLCSDLLSITAAVPLFGRFKLLPYLPELRLLLRSLSETHFHNTFHMFARRHEVHKRWNGTEGVCSHISAFILAQMSSFHLPWHDLVF